MNVHTHISEDRVATIRLHRPPLNILNLELLTALRAAAKQLSSSPDIKAVVLYGGSAVFSAGADIRELVELTSATVPAHARAMQEAVSSVARIPVPVIAAVCGPAVGGGCELALAADFRVCADDSSIGLPEVLLGVIPTGGGTQRLTSAVGLPRAKELIYSGRTLDAAEALEIGLVDRSVPAAEVLREAQQWAGRYRDSSTSALRAAKSAVDFGQEAGLEHELRNFIDCFNQPDRVLGMTSFLDQGPGRARFDARTANGRAPVPRTASVHR